jgi:Ca2+-binding RTX toxin-like protein
LEGGSEADWLTGGGGVDSFVFSAGSDVITDFRDREDKIVLGRAPWDGAVPTVGSLLDGVIVTETGLILDFGNGNALDIRGIFDATLLADDILFL